MKKKFKKLFWKNLASYDLFKEGKAAWARNNKGKVLFSCKYYLYLIMLYLKLLFNNEKGILKKSYSKAYMDLYGFDLTSDSNMAYFENVWESMKEEDAQKRRQEPSYLEKRRQQKMHERDMVIAHRNVAVVRTINILKERIEKTKEKIQNHKEDYVCNTYFKPNPVLITKEYLEREVVGLERQIEEELLDHEAWANKVRQSYDKKEKLED